MKGFLSNIIFFDSSNVSNDFMDSITLNDGFLDNMRGIIKIFEN